MSDKNANEFQILQSEIEQLKKQNGLGTKAARKLQELEDNLLVGMVGIAEAKTELLRFKEENKGKSIPAEVIKNHPVTTLKPDLIKNGKNHKTTTLTVPLVLTKIDNWILENVFKTQLDTADLLKLMVLCYERYSLQNEVSANFSNEVINELLAENLMEYDKIIENIKDNKNGILAAKKEAVRIIALSNNSMVIPVESQEDERFLLAELKKLIVGSSWPIILKMIKNI